MNETELRSLIGAVKDGRLSRRGFISRMLSVGLTAPMAGMLLAQSGVAFAQTRPAYKPTKAGGGGPLKILLWQAVDPHQSAFRDGHQGPGGLARLLRAARRLGQGRQPDPDPRRGGPEPRKRRALRRRHHGHLEAEARREVARRPAIHGRRRRLQLGVRGRSGDRRHHQRLLHQPQGRREGRRLHREGRLHAADAVLGRPLRRRRRHDHPEARLRRVQGRQVARGAGQPRGRSGPAPTSSSTSSPATSFAASATPTTTSRTSRISTRSRSRAAATPSRRPGP